MTQSLTGAADQARDLPAFPMTRIGGPPLDPPAALRALQSQAPLVKVRLWDGRAVWMVTRHAEMRALLPDPRISADPLVTGYPAVNAMAKERPGDFRTFLNMDDPDHGRIRRMLTGTFTVKRTETLRPSVQSIVDGLIDDLLASPKPADLVRSFALPVPSLVICRLLGVPYSDHDFFQRNSAMMINRETPPMEAYAARMALTEYLDGLVETKLGDPGDDLLSRLANEQVKAGQLTRRDLADLGVLLLLAGHETTTNMITLGTVALLSHPDQIAALRDDPDPALVARAVEELLRYLMIVQFGLRRVALADIEIGGEVIRAGEGIVMPNDLANRDSAAFPDPGRLDIHRDARRHMAFGFGIHQCLGQPLARLELQVVYGTLYRRIPSLALACDAGDLPYKHDGFIYGIYELPVTW